MPLTQDDKQSNSDYQDLEKTIELLVNEPCYTVDEYFSKSDLFTSIINNNDIDTELREIICQEQIKFMENDFVKNFIQNLDVTLYITH